MPLHLFRVTRAPECVWAFSSLFYTSYVQSEFSSTVRFCRWILGICFFPNQIFTIFSSILTAWWSADAFYFQAIVYPGNYKPGNLGIDLHNSDEVVCDSASCDNSAIVLAYYVSQTIIVNHNTFFLFIWMNIMWIKQLFYKRICRSRKLCELPSTTVLSFSKLG